MNLKDANLSAEIENIYNSFCIFNALESPSDFFKTASTSFVCMAPEINSLINKKEFDCVHRDIKEMGVFSHEVCKATLEKEVFKKKYSPKILEIEQQLYRQIVKSNYFANKTNLSDLDYKEKCAYLYFARGILCIFTLVLNVIRVQEESSEEFVKEWFKKILNTRQKIKNMIDEINLLKEIVMCECNETAKA
ncbi:hypothetical protein KY314_04780 [Candidatus Woesearchaeota archaeon]|nr:hypothetical protein [Candidatus Woesearchaeota archaeon]